VSSSDPSIVAHYAHGALLRAIDDAIVAAGKDPLDLTPADLAPIDEFHIGGRRATDEFVTEFARALGDAAAVPLEDRDLLDIGCGLGGAARHVVATLRCRVTGIDLSAEYVAVAAELTRRVGLDASIDYRAASATALPFATGVFDGAYMLHVGMNIADKAALFAEARRVLKRGAVLGLYDVMRAGDGALAYPLPWAGSPVQSFVETPAAYRAFLARAGFRLVAERDRSAAAREFFHRTRARAAERGQPPLGLHVVMGADTAKKAANVAALIEHGTLAPVEMLARAE
jgi:SAM-dependent methyltransferase